MADEDIDSLLEAGIKAAAQLQVRFPTQLLSLFTTPN